jgi:hypothetical protein
MAEVATTAKKIIANVENVIVGKRSQIVLSLVSWFCEGHILLEDVPGVAKTMLARDPTLTEDVIRTFGHNMFGGDFVFSVSREFVRRCRTPLLLQPGTDKPHPAATSAEIAQLAPQRGRATPQSVTAAAASARAPRPASEACGAACQRSARPSRATPTPPE